MNSQKTFKEKMVRAFYAISPNSEQHLVDASTEQSECPSCKDLGYVWRDNHHHAHTMPCPVCRMSDERSFAEQLVIATRETMQMDMFTPVADAVRVEQVEMIV